MAVTALPGHGLPAGALVLLRGSPDGFSGDERMFVRLFALWAAPRSRSPASTSSSRSSPRL
ncbi:hypothetical protein ACFQ0B_18050 [Nonomuraea thailandensis]